MKKLKNVLALLCAAVMVLTLLAPAVDTAKVERAGTGAGEGRHSGAY